MQETIQNNWLRSGQDVCQITGYYWPHIDSEHRQLIYQGEQFPLFENQQVRWILIEPYQAIEKNQEIQA